MKEEHKNKLIEMFGAEKADNMIKKIIFQENELKLYEEKEDKKRRNYLTIAIPKKELIKEVVYEGICERLEHNKTAKWNGEKFIVEKYEFGYCLDFEIDHIEDVIDNNYAGFIPLNIKE